MSEKLALEFPYNQDWSYGYIQTNRENRLHVYLYKIPTDNERAKRSTTQYARYLMSVQLGRYLLKVETVDHIDGNKGNNNLDNLQILSRKENIKKYLTSNHIAHTMVTLACPVCNKLFSRQLHHVKSKLEHGKHPCCSRKCGYIHTAVTLKKDNLLKQ